MHVSTFHPNCPINPSFLFWLTALTTRQLTFHKLFTLVWLARKWSLRIPPHRGLVLALWGVRWDWLCSSAGTRRCRLKRQSWSPPWWGAELSALHPAGSEHQSSSAAPTSELAATLPVLRKSHRWWGYSGNAGILTFSAVRFELSTLFVL